MQGESQEHTLLRSPVSGRKPAFPEPTHKHTSAAISVRTLTDIVPHSVRAHGLTQPRQPGPSPHEPWTTADDVEGITWCVCVCNQPSSWLTLTVVMTPPHHLLLCSSLGSPVRPSTGDTWMQKMEEREEGEVPQAKKK